MSEKYINIYYQKNKNFIKYKNYHVNLLNCICSDLFSVLTSKYVTLRNDQIYEQK